MKTREWLLAELIKTSTKLAESQAETLQINLNNAREEIAALKQRVAELAPQKQFVVREGGLSGDAAVRIIQSVYSTKGVTTITL
jgi:hypothetical protein